MLRSAANNCTENNRCRSYDPCPRCQCSQILTRDDWRIVDFYRCVSDQVVETGRDFMPRLEGYRAALELGGYDREEWPWLTEGARMLHGFVYKTSEVDWFAETGKRLRDIRPEDVTNGD